MCNRVATPQQDEMKGYFDKLASNQHHIFRIEPYQPYYHISSFGMPLLPFISRDEPTRIAPAMWKFLPAGASIDAFKKYDTANAKAEEIFEKQTYKKYVLPNRGLLILKGFFEGQEQPDKTSQPYFIYPSNGDLLTLGCVYSDWYDAQRGVSTRTFSIITTAANSRMAEIHNKKRRMPLVILPEDREQWLSNLDREGIEDMMRPLPDGLLTDHKVSRNLYKTKIDTNLPEILLPVAD
jgi:putative SOS response-associated peptidase YedK